jgi:hypothetical protein
MKIEKKYYMKKRNFYSIFVIIVMLSVTHTTVPILTMAFLKDTHRVITRTADIGSSLAIFGWVFATFYFCAHCIQVRKINVLHDKCAQSPENTFEEHKKSLSKTTPFIGTLFYNQAILKCMKHKGQNLKNFNECLDLVDRLIGKE